MPQWKMTVDLKDVFALSERPYVQTRDMIVKAIRESEWSSISGRPEVLEFLVGALAETGSPAQGSHAWGALYDLADEDRVWLETF